MAVMARAAGVAVRPITEADLPRVARFLQANMNARVPVERWVGALDVPWTAERPNLGFMLVEQDEVVGAHLAYYSTRTIGERTERFCNLAAWCVLPAYRLHGLKLLKALLAQPDHHFTDLSPSGNVVRINTRLGFRQLDAATALVPNLPWPSWPRRDVVVSSDPAVIEHLLTGPELGLFRDHAGAAAARHLVLADGDRRCYVVFRRDHWKRLPWFVSILHVSDPDLFRELRGRASRHLLLRHGALATLAEDRIVRHRARLSLRIPAPRARMYLSESLEPEQVDYLYSELTCLAW